jgi:hypothetical protein
MLAAHLATKSPVILQHKSLGVYKTGHHLAPSRDISVPKLIKTRSHTIVSSAPKPHKWRSHLFTFLSAKFRM